MTPDRREYMKIWRAENKEKSNALKKIYRAENKEKIKELRKKYRAENKEKIRYYNHERVRDLKSYYLITNLMVQGVSKKAIKDCPDLISIKKLQIQLYREFLNH